MANETTVLLVEPGTEWLNALSREAGFNVLGSTPSLDSCLSLARDLQPDVVVLDVEPPEGSDRVEIAMAITKEVGAYVVMVSSKPNLSELASRRLTGRNRAIWGHLLRRTPLKPQLLRRALAIESSRGWIDEALAAGLRVSKNPAMFDQLTTRQQQVMALIDLGLSYKEVADQLYFVELSVHTYVRSVFASLWEYLDGQDAAT